MIPEEHKTSLISSGLHFMRCITEAYGADKGLELWEQIASVLDPDVKGQIFFAMITGNYNDRITIKGIRRDDSAVACIKAIRGVDKRGLGLKDAKDLYDRVRSGSKSEYIMVHHEMYHVAVNELHDVGFMV